MEADAQVLTLFHAFLSTSGILQKQRGRASARFELRCKRTPAEQVKNLNCYALIHGSSSRASLLLAFIHLASCAATVLASPAPQGVSRVRNIKGQFNLARPQLPSILIQTAMTEELIFHLSEGRSRPLNHCNSH